MVASSAGLAVIARPALMIQILGSPRRARNRNFIGPALAAGRRRATNQKISKLAAVKPQLARAEPVMNLGIAGLGKMGAAIGTRLLGQGHKLAVWNRTADKAKPLVAAGATAVGAPADVAAAAEAVITILTDASAIESVYGGPKGLLSAAGAGTPFLYICPER